MASPSKSTSSFTPFSIVIKNHYQPTYSLHLTIDSPDTTIGQLKTKIEQQHKGNPLIQDQLLVYRGKLLESKTNLFQLLQSSIIKPLTPTNKNNNNTPDHDTTSPSMYIHMTLRGGSDTAKKINLTQNTPTPPPKNPPQPEEQKYEKKPTCTIPPQFTSPYPHPRPHHHPPPYSHYYSMPPPPPPPNAYYFSHSMPDLYHPNAYLHRAQSVPSNPSHPSHPFGPPTLVQQASNPNINPHQNAPFHPMHVAPSYHPHYMPHGPPPHGPPGPPGFHRFGVRSHSTSDLRYLRNINPNAPPRIVPSKIEEKDEKNETVDNNNNNNDGVNVERFGLRQRRVQNVVNDNNNNMNGGNVVNNNNNNNNDNVNVRNGGDNNNNNNNVVREGWFPWFFRILNINVLIRLGIFMWLFGPNLGTYRFTILCVLGGFYYLHQIGILHRIFGRFMRRNRNRNRNEEVQHRDPNAVNDGSDNNNNNERTAPLLPLNYVQLLQRFLIGIFASLWPTWDHRNVYPANPQ